MSFSKKVYLCFTVLLIQIFCTIRTAPAQTTLPSEDIAEKALAATVYLEMRDKNGKTLGISSGFFVKSNLIATNYHVIEGAAKGTAKLVDKNKKYKIEGVTAIDKGNDLVLLQVPAYGIYGVKGIKPLSLGDSDKVRIGETVYVAGNPKGLEGTFSDGIISSRRDKLTKERLQMTAPISPGSGGGPVLNRKGEVIGVSFLTVQGGQNLNFAIPSRFLMPLLVKSVKAEPLLQRTESISAETYFNWAYVKDEMGDYKGAIGDYTKAIQLKPDYVDAYVNRGASKHNSGQYHDAIVDYGIAIKLKPDYALAYSNRGIAKHYLGQHTAAISDCNKAIQLKPDYADAYNNRTIARLQLGQHLSAIADCNKAIQLKPDYAEAYNNRGLTKIALGEYIDAIADCNKAIEIKPELVATYFTRGLAKVFLGQFTEVIIDCEKAIQLKPDYADAYYLRGLAKVGMGQLTDAISDCNKAINIDPNYAKAYFTRGFAKYRLGRSLEAKPDLNTALRLAKQSSDKNLITQIEALLQKLN